MSSQPGDVLEGFCAGAQRLVLVAPYIKADALTKILASIDPAASLACVTRWNPHDLATGASDPECRTIVKKFGGSFRLHPTLHAKYYRIDDVVLVGSANLTSSAMGWSSQPNLEILCRPSDDFEPYTFENNMFRDAREISDEEFHQWEAIAKINTQIYNAIVASPPMLDSWRPTTREPRHLEVSYQGREEDIASFDEQIAARRDIQTLLIPPGLSDEQVRMWASASLLAAPFTNTVIRLHNAMDLADAVRVLAETYGLGLTEARRDMETVQNWLAYLAPEHLRSD